MYKYITFSLLAIQSLKFKMSSQIEKCIGSGGFGQVYEIEGTNLYKKQMNIKFHENLREVCFLSTYNQVPFITEMVSCEIDKDKDMINLYMKNAGETLRNLCKKLNIKERIKLVPVLLTQFSRILLWMKEENIIHGDIKPANICIDINSFVRLIDWGFVQKVYKGNAYSNGTPIFSEPEAFHDKRIDYESEMFAFGISICYFLSKGLDYDDWEEFLYKYDVDEDYDEIQLESKNEEALQILQFDIMKTYFLEEFGDYKYYDIICSMINLNKNKRIDDIALFDSCPSELKLKYPLTECYSHIEYQISTSIPEFQKSLNNKKLGILINWLINVKFKLNIKASLFNAIQLFFKYINKKDVNDKNLQQVGIICLYISNIMNNEYILTLERCAKLCYEKDVNVMMNILIDILNTLEYNVFPESENVEFNKKNEDIFTKVFITQSQDFDHPFIDSYSFDLFYNNLKNNKDI